MTTFKNNQQKAEYVISSISSGRDANTVARDLGYKNVKSLDMFMRREGYYKDRRIGNYVPKNATREDGAPTQANPGSKVWEIIALYREQPGNPKQIAYQVGFENTREMANYMKSKGFVWDSDRNNYVPEVSDDTATAEAPKDSQIQENPEQEYQLLLQYLLSRKDKLVALLESGSEGNLPRYMVPGVFLTKSVHMSNRLDRMVRDYSTEKNIGQRDVFEIALIDFFKKYGYGKEVDVLLQDRD